MRNLWIQTENAFVTWIADFTAVRSRPAAILEFIQATLASGTLHRVYDLVEAPLMGRYHQPLSFSAEPSSGYSRDRDGTPSDLLRRMLERNEILDLFGFTGSAMMPGRPRSSAVETTLCYYDRTDQLVERTVTDLGAVLASLEPVPDCIPDGFMCRYPAVRITGREYTGVRTKVRRVGSLPIAAFFSIHSDIWFPWVYGSAHPECDYRRMFDNRELANRHTPRLNAFLGEVAAAARRAGGSFGVDQGDSEWQARRGVNDESVLLDWQPSNEIMPPEMLNVEWY